MLPISNYKVSHCTEKDIATILAMYETARNYMKSKNQVYWPYFPESSIRNEIKEKRLWCILIDGDIACIWTSTFSDPIIWEEKSSDPSLYLHKIVTDSKHRGKSLVSAIVDWAKTHAIKNNKQYIRMDTVGNNQSLINHYKKHGFDFLGIAKLSTTRGLPDHYKDGDVCYFEIKL